MSEFERDVKALMARGFVVHPLWPKGGSRSEKSPKLVGWQNPIAPSDCWQRFKPADARVGILCGEASGLLVVDIDRVKADDEYCGNEWMMDLEAANDETICTLGVRTPSGGLHLYFAWDERMTEFGNSVRFHDTVDSVDNNNRYTWQQGPSGGSAHRRVLMDRRRDGGKRPRVL
jgi:hypothetical protein